MSALLELSHELLHCIFVEVEPRDLATLCRTCRAVNDYISGNRLLHKDIYTRRYDELLNSTRDAEPDWQQNVRDLTCLERILESESRESKSNALGFVAKHINHLIDTACTDPDKSLNLQVLSGYFDDTANIDTFLCSSSLFSRAGNENQQAAATRELQQASAKLHCLFGVPIDHIPSRASFTIHRPHHMQLSPSACTRNQMRPLPTHAFARSKVYDLRQYTDNTLWGPFMDDGSHRIDWERVEAIMIVLGYNLNKFTERSDGRWPRVWHKPFVGATPNSYLSLPPSAAPEKDDMDEEMIRIRSLAASLDAQDPYGVSGTWMRVVCFLDYNDLYAFNFSSRIPDDEPRAPIDTDEGIIDLAETLQVTKIEPPGSGDEYDDDDDDDGMDWSNFVGERLPVVHFRGTSKSLHASWDPNANSKIRGVGTVRQTPEGEIRWTTFSIFHGEERWRSEGIQVGGLKSARGVLGNWFDKDYDLHGPAGPTAFWKMTDELDDDKSGTLPVAYF
ncbi:hypothetical protein BAUCODRAFT_27821 [Baudoinia panamericana UAMH 10762]|uniref:F-box domain-containing protein n=1 Tax=Baudoinia panamericana (strain UAMH 10762) TaxID=717646 RepID=M2MYZ1_BAUPA|nr:uncharacterized protein BAUCODRAFT_27821 [Baudoinia panamericana UAMH 10762]EMC91520.1 hypothetical protein BAUCODRAFT_27821 [Baudoinia panamericana UAMH 10762]